MQKSDQLNELALALSIVQGELEGAKQDSENPYFHSKYADLTSVWSACRKVLTENGLSVAQTFSIGEDDGLIIDTTLLHKSGQWISGELAIKPIKNDPQGVGSAITYARRYGLAAIVGICPEDDDAELATEHKPVREQESKSTIDKSEHYCSIHDTNFFMKGKMKGYAHKIEGTNEWCNESSPEPPQSTPDPTIEESGGNIIDWMKESCAEIKWSDKTIISYLGNFFHISKEGTIDEVIARLSEEQRQTFIKEIQDRLAMK